MGLLPTASLTEAYHDAEYIAHQIDECDCRDEDHQNAMHDLCSDSLRLLEPPEDVTDWRVVAAGRALQESGAPEQLAAPYALTALRAAWTAKY